MLRGVGPRRWGARTLLSNLELMRGLLEVVEQAGRERVRSEADPSQAWREGEGRLKAYLMVDMFMPYCTSRFRSLTNVGVRERRDGPKVVSTVQVEMGSICRIGSSKVMRKVLGQSSGARRKDVGARGEEEKRSRVRVRLREVGRPR